MNIKPVSSYVFITPDEPENMSKGGVILPENGKEKPTQGVVKFVGPGARTTSGKLIPTEVKPGDKVLYTQYSGSEVKVDNQTYMVVREQDLMAVLS